MLELYLYFSIKTLYCHSNYFTTNFSNSLTKESNLFIVSSIGFVLVKLTPALLFWAVQENQMGIVKPLLEKGVNVNVKDKEGWTPLHMASWNEYSEMVKYLIEKGADVNAKTKKGWTAEDIAKLPKEKKVNLTREEVLFIKKQRSEKAKEIRSIDADAQGKAINHSLRRTLFGGKQIGHNAPMLKVVSIRLKEHQNNA